MTKYSIGIPMEGISSTEITNVFVKRFICRFGSPIAILADQEANFTSSLIKKVAKRFRIKQYTMSAYHLQSNSSIERSHHLLTEYLKLYIENSRNGDEWVELDMFSYNSPVLHELVFGHLAGEPCYVAWKGPRDVLHCLTVKAQASLKKPSINLRPRHKPSLISWQEALILQVFSVYNWYLKSPSVYCTFCQITEKGSSYLMGKTK